MKLLREYISYNDVELITEVKDDDSSQKSYFLKGPFLEAGTKNRNGREYMKETLIREVQEFNDTKIKTRRSMGELDHPECYLNNDFKVVTKDGWKSFTDLTVGDDIATLNTETNIIEYNPIQRIIDEPYTGYAYHIYGRNINSKITPTHRLLLEDVYGNTDYYTIDEIYNNRNKFDEYMLLDGDIDDMSSGSGIYLGDDSIHIDKIDHDDNVYCLTVENSNFYIKDNNKTYWTGNSPAINLDRISHFITELTMDGNVGYGVAKLLNTPMGNIAKALVDDGLQLGMSTRGVGTLDGDMVKDDYKLITIDIVADPSAPTAFVEGVLENREYIVGDNGEIVEAAVRQLKADMDKVVVENAFDKDKFSKATLQYLDDFLTSIKSL